ncbi:MAG TPA: sugar phosphate isomerase/epimerase family protein [Nitrospiria bacterium]|nr:sugar phosphate isomerase/epimerase family protein [Nitrospiria bacterium]
MGSIQVHIPYSRIDENISLIMDNRLNLEILLDADSVDSISESLMEDLMARLSYVPVITIHAPFLDLSPGSTDSFIRRATMERLMLLDEKIRPLSPKKIVFHTGYDKWSFNGNKEMWLKNSLAFWGSFIERLGSRRGYDILIENIFEDEPDYMVKLLKGIDSPSFGFCFDIGHCNVFSKVGIEDWIAALGDKLQEVHIHDNHGKSDEHLGIGEGTIGFDSFFKLLDKEGIDPFLTIEGHSKPAVEKSLLYLKRYER